MTFPAEAPADRDLRRLRTLYRALGDETRLRVIGLLAEHGPLPVNELSARVGLSQPLISWHLRILRLVGGSLLDAVDGALARATGGGTPFGGFLDSTLDRAGEAIVYLAIAAYYLRGDAPTWPVLAAFIALAGSFMVSYSRARAEGIGVTASIGIAPRTERLVLIVAGLGLAGLGIGPALIAALWVIAALTVATTAQRIWHVWRLTAATRG